MGSILTTAKETADFFRNMSFTYVSTYKRIKYSKQIPRTFSFYTTIMVH